MTTTQAATPVRINRRNLLSLALATAALAACGTGDSGIKKDANAARRKELLDRLASEALAAGLVSTSLSYADRQSSATAVAGVRQKGAPAATAIGDWLRIGSASKAMTACMAARLIERGQLSWTLSLADALPDLASGMQPEFRTVTVEQLLTHRGGLIALNNSGEVNLFLEFLGEQNEPLPDTYEGRRRFLAAWALAQAQPGVTPGRDFQYSNAGYMLVGMILEAKSGKSFAALFDELIVALVGPGVSFGLPTTAGTALQRGHQGARAGVQVFNGYPPELQVWADVLDPGAGGVFVTVTGYAKWQQLHQQALAGESTQLPAGYVQRLRTSNDIYAVGWDLGTLPDASKGKAVISHEGTEVGFTVSSVIARDGQFAIGAFTNTEATGTDEQWVMNLLYKAIFGMQAGWA
jgi:D-alanyl-D-alanine carboxypeptidase